jgi:adenosylhomocysteine nucleosidase
VNGVRRLGVIAALPQELGDVLAHLSDATTERRAQRDYHCGRVGQREVVAVTARVGKVAAALTATTLIERFEVDAIVFVGVAGGLGSGVEIGDIVIATALAQHDMDASPLFERGELPLLGVSAIACDTTLTLALRRAAQFAIADWTGQAHHPAFTRTQLHQGLIVSGDQFIHAPGQAQAIAHVWPQALAAEMEGAAVAQVCFEHGIPVAVVRTISDRADASAPTDFTQFLTEVAAPMSSGILRHLLRGTALNPSTD